MSDSMKGQRVRKVTFEQDFFEKEMAFLKMEPKQRLAWNMEIQRKIWGKALRKSSYRKMRVKKQLCDSNDV
jgi:hypothetical protein